MMNRRTILLLPLTLPAAALAAQQTRVTVGPLPGGGFLLNNGWKLKPAGTGIPLDTFPMASALSRDGKFLVVLNAGYNPPSLSVIDTAARKELGRTAVPDGWLGLAFSARGDRLYVGGGAQGTVYEFSFAAGKLTPARAFPIAPPEKRSGREFIGDVKLSPDGRLLYAADVFGDRIVVINPQSGMVTGMHKTGRRPYRILFHPDGRSFFVSSWMEGSVYHHQTDTGGVLTRLRIGPHPTDMIWRSGRPPLGEAEQAEKAAEPDWMGRVFVTASNTNRVHVLGVSESNSVRSVETINVALEPMQPSGMTPSALALSPDRNRLYIVCSDANAVAVADVSEPRSRPLGFIPTGWYPTAAAALQDGSLIVLNGRGQGSQPNPKGGNVAAMQTGTASFIDAPGDERLESYSETFLANTPYSDVRMMDAKTGAGNPVPSTPGQPTPIRHVIYIIKENRSYDQVLGDMKQGNGDASLAAFGERVTPNHHKLAREFVLFDNFYVNGDVDADGFCWSTAAIAPDYVQKMWPAARAGRRKGTDLEGQEVTAMPPAGYLWTNASSAGLSMRNYGMLATNLAKADPDGSEVMVVHDPALTKATNRRYRGFDLDYPDVERAKVFVAELGEFEKSGQLPRLILMRLGNDRTSGAAPGKIAPESAMADNDLALGMIVEAVTKSRFWPATAIFVVEDDAQGGADHVDSHRAPVFVISPYVKRGAVDSAFYNSASVLRTMELLLGLRPMTHFDASATPMSAAFQAQPDARPYTAEQPRTPLDRRNGAPAAP